MWERDPVKSGKNLPLAPHIQSRRQNVLMASKTLYHLAPNTSGLQPSYSTFLPADSPPVIVDSWIFFQHARHISCHGDLALAIPRSGFPPNPFFQLLHLKSAQMPLDDVYSWLFKITTHLLHPSSSPKTLHCFQLSLLIPPTYNNFSHAHQLLTYPMIYLFITTILYDLLSVSHMREERFCLFYSPICLSIKKSAHDGYLMNNCGKKL